MEGSSLGLVVSGDLSREKYSEGESPGENFPGGNYSEIIAHWPKFRRLIVLGGDFIRAIIWGIVVQGVIIQG